MSVHVIPFPCGKWMCFVNDEEDAESDEEDEGEEE